MLVARGRGAGCPLHPLTQPLPPQTALYPFHVANSGDVPVSLRWQAAAPFTIHPPAADLAPGAKAHFKASFECARGEEG